MTRYNRAARGAHLATGFLRRFLHRITAIQIQIQTLIQIQIQTLIQIQIHKHFITEQPAGRILQPASYNDISTNQV